MINTEIIVKLITEQKLKPQTFKIFIYLISLIDDCRTKKVKRMTQIEMSNELKIDNSNFNKAIKELIKANIIYKDNRDYYFNKDLFRK